MPCKISGDPKRPYAGCPIFYLQRGDYVRKVGCRLYVHVEIDVVLQIRDDHHDITVRVMSTQGKKPPRSSLLPSERAALGQSSLTTSGLAKHGGAALADDNGLGVREDGGDGEATGALDVHEERSGGGHKSL